MTSDPISELIIKLKNASATGKESVVFPYSKLRSSILDVLEKQGFVSNLTKKGKKVTKFIEADIVYEAGMPKLHGVQRISKYSKRVYQKAKDLKPVRNNFGSLILTTPKGILTDREARKQKVGGEALFKIW